MRALNHQEVQNLAEDMTRLLGARLQQVRAGTTDMSLGLYLDGRLHWLMIDLQPSSPVALISDSEPAKGITTPVKLFLNAHGVGLRLKNVQCDNDLERVLRLSFGEPPDPLQMEIRLFPHGQNLIVRKGEKRISFHKVKELKTGSGSTSSTVRSIPQILKEWKIGRAPKEGFKPANKKLEAMKRDLEIKKSQNRYLEIGEWLKTHQSLDVPDEYAQWINPNLSLSENIQSLFSKAKAMKRKIAATEQRLEQLKAGTLEPPKARIKESKKKPLAKYRTLKIDDSMEAQLGKSGADNLTLLRLAKPWDVWMHLRDQPGAHLILRRPKKREVSKDVFQQLIRWLVKETAAKKFRQGDIVEVQWQEVRFVRPIKGETLGRVLVQEPRYKRLRL